MTIHALPDTATLQRLAHGDQAAFHDLYTQYWPQVYGTALHLTRSPELAKDLAQDIFLKIWEGRAQLPVIQNFGGYLFTVSRNLVIDYLRKKVFDPANLDFLVQYFQAESPGGDQTLEFKELQATIICGNLTKNAGQPAYLGPADRIERRTSLPCGVPIFPYICPRYADPSRARRKTGPCLIRVHARKPAQRLNPVTCKRKSARSSPIFGIYRGTLEWILVLCI